MDGFEVFRVQSLFGGAAFLRPGGRGRDDEGQRDNDAPWFGESPESRTQTRRSRRLIRSRTERGQAGLESGGFHAPKHSKDSKRFPMADAVSEQTGPLADSFCLISFFC